MTETEMQEKALKEAVSQAVDGLLTNFKSRLPSLLPQVDIAALAFS
jgi:hypothetical protein